MSGRCQLLGLGDDWDHFSHYIEYRRLAVQGRVYALLQPGGDLDMLVAFRVEAAEDNDKEVYIPVMDAFELETVSAVWQKLHS